MKMLISLCCVCVAVSLLALAICAPAFADTVAALASDAQPMDWLTAAKAYLATPLMISALCSFLSAILPQGAPGTPWGIVRKVIDFAAMNFGNAKNLPRV